MKKWKVDYAYRKDGKYCEGTLFIEAFHIDNVLYDANAILSAKSLSEGWEGKLENGFVHRFKIWDIGIVAEADEEVF